MPPSSTFSDIPVAFDVNDGEQAQTRALTTEETLKASEDTGFGVFAYYTTQKATNPDPSKGETTTGQYVSTTYPNFMYNQNVYWEQIQDDGTPIDKEARYWKYTPLKYWPNDYSSGDVGGGATGSSRNDNVSFFAYAPYVKCDPLTGQALHADNTVKKVGIVGFTNNTGYNIVNKSEGVTEREWSGDPQVHYKLADEDLDEETLNHLRTEDFEDLMWGQPLLNKNKSDGVQNFSFQHTLTGINFMVGGMFDALDVSGEIAPDTYISIEEVKIETKLAYESWFNLNTGTWGTTDLKEGFFLVDKNNINEQLAYKDGATDRYNNLSVDHTNEVNQGVGRNADGEVEDNDDDKIYPLMKPVKVGEDAEGHDILKNQFAMIIPAPGSFRECKVTCTYHVWTFDPRNPNGITKVKNTITNEVTLSNIDKGKCYNLTMWLGMTTMKLKVNEVPGGGYYIDNEDSSPWQLSSPWIYYYYVTK